MQPQSTNLPYAIEDRGYKTPCWIFRGYIHESGYGRLKVGGRLRYAHVVSYEARFGPIPKGLDLDHLCQVKPCINPDHGEPVTHTENVRRGPHTLLTLDEVHLIRELRGKVAGIELAQRFGVTKSCISKIHQNKIWHDPDYVVVPTAKDVFRLSALNPEDVGEIRRLRGVETGAALARRFAVSPSTISAIQLGQRLK